MEGVSLHFFVSEKLVMLMGTNSSGTGKWVFDHCNFGNFCRYVYGEKSAFRCQLASLRKWFESTNCSSRRKSPSIELIFAELVVMDLICMYFQTDFTFGHFSRGIATGFYCWQLDNFTVYLIYYKTYYRLTCKDTFSGEFWL